MKKLQPRYVKKTERVGIRLVERHYIELECGKLIPAIDENAANIRIEEMKAQFAKECEPIIGGYKE